MLSPDILPLVRCARFEQLRCLEWIDFVTRQTIEHNHKSVNIDGSQDMPSSMQLKHEPPRDTHCLFEYY